MKNIDSKGHVTGKSIYLDDIPLIQGTRFGVVFDSPVAHGTIESINYSKARAIPGVIKIITHEDIPGQNQIGGIISDEQLFASKEVLLGNLLHSLLPNRTRLPLQLEN